MFTTIPEWFDEDYFAEQKIAQLNALNWGGRSDWDMAGYKSELAKYNVTPYENFLACNEARDLAYTNISPNRLFNVQEYLTALADYANKTGYTYGSYKRGEWTAQKAMEHMFNDYGVSAWDHFTLAGQVDLINPSNAFDIRAYYQELTDFRNNYVDDLTGEKGWEGRTDWTLDEVVRDNIYADVNPIAGILEEGKLAGISVNPVAQANQVSTDAMWNPWVAQPDDPDAPVKPDKPLNPDYIWGGLDNWGNSDTEPEPEPVDPDFSPVENDETVEVGNNAAAYQGKAEENTLFNAAAGLNPDSTINGGAASNNTLQVNLQTSFDGFAGVKKDGKVTPNVVNVQNVVLNADANGNDVTFNARNMQDVEQWHIENGPVNLESLPDTDVAVTLRNITQAPNGINIGFSESALANGNKSLALGLDKTGDSQTGQPLAVNAEGIKKLVVATAQDSQNHVDLSGVDSTDSITLKGAGDLAVAGIAGGTQKLDASNMTGNLTVNLGDSGNLQSVSGGKGENYFRADSLNATVAVDGGAGDNDTLELNDSGEYSGKWQNLENLVVKGQTGADADGAPNQTALVINGANITGLQTLIVNSDTPDANANVTLENLKANKFSVEDHTSVNGNSEIVLSGKISQLEFTAKKPLLNAPSLQADENIDISENRTNLYSDVSDTATIRVEEGVNLTGSITLPQASRLVMDDRSDLGNWTSPKGTLHVSAHNAGEVAYTGKAGGYTSFYAPNADFNATLEGRRNLIDVDARNVKITGTEGSNRLNIGVWQSAEIDGGGGEDEFVVRSFSGAIQDADRPETPIKVTLNGRDSLEREVYNIYGGEKGEKTIIEINGFDATDQLYIRDGTLIDAEGGAINGQQCMTDFFGIDDLENFQRIMDYRSGEACGYWDSENGIAYGFNLTDNEVTTAIKVNAINSMEMAERAIHIMYNSQEKVFLAKDKLEYANAVDANGHPVPTVFFSEVNGADSTLVPGVKINASDKFDNNQLVVEMRTDFSGIGETGKIQNVQHLELINYAGKPLSFNSENMEDIQYITLLNNSITVTGLENTDLSLFLHHLYDDNSFVGLKFSDKALENMEAGRSLFVSTWEMDGNNVNLIADHIEDVTFYHHHNDSVDISQMPDVSHIDIMGIGAFNITGANDRVEAVAITIDADSSVTGSLQWNNAETMIVTAAGGIGTDSVALNLEAKGSIAIEARTANIVGGAGDDTYFAFVSEKAEISGEGGNDTFVANAHIDNADSANQNESDAAVVEVTFNGVKNDSAMGSQERFIINTAEANAKLALTINGYDSNDSIEILNTKAALTPQNISLDGDRVEFATVKVNEIKDILAEFGITTDSKLVSVGGSEEAYAFYDEAKDIAYGFAPTDAAGNDLVACIKVMGVGGEEGARQAFGYEDSETGETGQA